MYFLYFGILNDNIADFDFVTKGTLERIMRSAQQVNEGVMSNNYIFLLPKILKIDIVMLNIAFKINNCNRNIKFFFSSFLHYFSCFRSYL